MRIISKLNHLLSTKDAIRKAILDKGVEIPTSAKFSDYPRYISLITTGGGSTEITPTSGELNIKTDAQFKLDIKSPVNVSVKFNDGVEIENNINIKLQGGSN